MTSSLIRTFLSAIQPSTPDGFATGINPMAAYSTTPDLSFYNLCGILRIGITGKDTTIQSISFSDNSGKELQGSLTMPEIPAQIHFLPTPDSSRKESASTADKGAHSTPIHPVIFI